jgi:hypothetical protein
VGLSLLHDFLTVNVSRVIIPMPNPQPGGSRTALYLARYPLTCVAWVELLKAYSYQHSSAGYRPLLYKAMVLKEELFTSLIYFLMIMFSRNYARLDLCLSVRLELRKAIRTLNEDAVVWGVMSCNLVSAKYMASHPKIL